jgi:gluconate 2-dehydrogenase gamma chain
MSENDFSRRDMLRSAAAAALLGQLTAEAAQHTHQQTAAEKKQGPYRPKLFNDDEYRTLTALTAIIIPSDKGGPSAADAGAPEFIDLLASHNEELALIYTGGLGWLDHEMLRRYNATFLDATAEQQRALLDLIAYRKNNSPEIGPGIRFFEWLRRMTVDAYFTSAAGTKDVGFMGNTGMTTFEVPKEALEYVLKRSPFGG